MSQYQALRALFTSREGSVPIKREPMDETPSAGITSDEEFHTLEPDSSASSPNEAFQTLEPASEGESEPEPAIASTSEAFLTQLKSSGHEQAPEAIEPVATVSSASIRPDEAAAGSNAVVEERNQSSLELLAWAASQRIRQPSINTARIDTSASQQQSAAPKTSSSLPKRAEQVRPPAAALARQRPEVVGAVPQAAYGLIPVPQSPLVANKGNAQLEAARNLHERNNVLTPTATNNGKTTAAVFQEGDRPSSNSQTAMLPAAMGEPLKPSSRNYSGAVPWSRPQKDRSNAVPGDTRRRGRSGTVPKPDYNAGVAPEVPPMRNLQTSNRQKFRLPPIAPPQVSQPSSVPIIRVPVPRRKANPTFVGPMQVPGRVLPISIGYGYQRPLLQTTAALNQYPSTALYLASANAPGAQYWARLPNDETRLNAPQDVPMQSRRSGQYHQMPPSVNRLETTLGEINQMFENMRRQLEEKDREIAELRWRLGEY